MARYRLPNGLETLQKQRYDSNGQFIGFQCQIECHVCPLRKFDHLDDDDAIKAMSGLYELHHSDGAKFSKTRTSLVEQLIMLCVDCHSLIHANDPSSSRFSW